MQPKRYTFHHIHLQQEELTFGEDGQIRGILAKIAALTNQNSTVGEILDAIYTAGIAEELFAVILKPREPTPLHMVWNKFWAWKAGVTVCGDSIIAILKNSQIIEVLADFFVLNTTWMQSFTAIASGSASGLKTEPTQMK